MKLIKFEFYKLVRTRSFYICVGVAMLLFAMSAYLNVLLKDQLGDLAVTMTRLSCAMTALASSSISMMLGIFISLFVCEDYSSGTIRTILARGYSRFEVYTSKFIAVIAAAFVMSAAVIIFACILGIFFFSGDVVIFGKLQVRMLLTQFVCVLGMAALFYAVATMLQKTGSSIAFCVVVPMMLTLLLQLLDTALVEQEIVVSRYWIEGLLSNISSVKASSHDINETFICSLVYLAVSLVGGWFATKDNEF